MKNKYSNLGKEILINDYLSINRNINCLSTDDNISNDITSFIDLKNKIYAKTTDNFYKKDNRNNKNIFSKINLSQHINSSSYSIDEYSVKQLNYKEKYEDIMIRMGKFLDNLFSLVKLPKELNVHESKFK